jgi:hypothetical protein
MKRFLALQWLATFATSVSIQGLRGTGDYGADERPKDFRETILWRDPNGQTPLTALMSKMGNEALTDPEFYWFEEELNHTRLVSHSSVILAATTALTIVPAGGLTSSGALAAVPSELFMIANRFGIVGSEEIVRVTIAPTSDTVVTVQRGVNGTVAADIPAGSLLVSLGTSFGEGTGAARSAFRNSTKFDNYAQIFKTSYEITETDKATTKRTGDAKKNDMKRKMFDHATKMEYAYLFGKKHLDIDPENGKPRRATQGIVRFLQSNKYVFKASPTGSELAWNEDAFLAALEPAFNYKAGGIGNERICFCGNGALTELNKLVLNSGGNSRINYDGIVSFYGMNLTRWTIPQGTLYFYSHPLMNTDPVYRYSMLGINPGALIDRALRKTKAQDNIQAQGQDSEKGQWLTESGLELHHERTHFYMSNMGAKLG